MLRAFYKENRMNLLQSSELPNIMDPFPGRLPVSVTGPVCFISIGSIRDQPTISLPGFSILFTKESCDFRNIEPPPAVSYFSSTLILASWSTSVSFMLSISLP